MDFPEELWVSPSSLCARCWKLQRSKLSNTVAVAQQPSTHSFVIIPPAHFLWHIHSTETSCLYDGSRRANGLTSLEVTALTGRCHLLSPPWRRRPVPPG